jgi:hypothetical protein
MEHPLFSKQRAERAAKADAAADATPFESLEATNDRAVSLAHREIVRLEAMGGLDESQVRSLKMLYEVIDRAKRMALEEFKWRQKYGKPTGNKLP